MKKFSVYAANGMWLFDVYAENPNEALYLAQVHDGEAAKVTSAA